MFIFPSLYLPLNSSPPPSPSSSSSKNPQMPYANAVKFSKSGSRALKGRIKLSSGYMSLGTLSFSSPFLPSFLSVFFPLLSSLSARRFRPRRIKSSSCEVGKGLHGVQFGSGTEFRFRFGFMSSSLLILRSLKFQSSASNRPNFSPCFFASSLLLLVVTSMVLVLPRERNLMILCSSSKNAYDIARIGSGIFLSAVLKQGSKLLLSPFTVGNFDDEQVKEE
mmetsp:Transcript_21089/g.37656  ORF Transcript_21089/g.37656 Transcript_21089/m.37656 type:complete len:221 (-) Transcript_21089:2522-3184(-)